MAMLGNPTTETLPAYWTGGAGQTPNQEPSYKNFTDTYQPHANVGADFLGTVRDSSGNRYQFWYDQVAHKITCITMDAQAAPTFTFIAYKVWNHPGQLRYGLSHLGQVVADPKYPAQANVAAGPQPSANVADPNKSNPASNPGAMDVWWDPVNKILNCDTVFNQSST